MGRKHNNTSTANTVPQSAKPIALYPDGSGRVGKSRPTFNFITSTDIAKVQTTYTRTQQVSAARKLYATCADLGAAINSKAEWVAGPGSFIPHYTGENRQWGDLVSEWLVENYYPSLCVNGPNYNMNKLLEVSSIALDVDGDHAIYFTYSRDGLPRIGLLPSHRIGNRHGQDKVTQKGKYEGYTLYDGIVVNDIGMPIAVQVLGSEEKKDVIKPYGMFDLLFDAEWSEMYRGISRIARSRFDWEDRDDIDEFIKRYIKLSSALNVTYKNNSGMAHDSPFAVGVTADTTTTGTETGVDVTSLQGGEILFLNAKNGEDINVTDNKNPSPEVEQAMARITGRALYSVGWPPELMNPKALSGAPTRMVQDMFRKTISKRHALLKARANKIVLFGIATAMEVGLIPRNNKDWNKWNFSTGNQLTVDGGNEAKADIENLKMGLDTYANICAKQGRDYFDVLQQNKTEGIEFIQAADQMAKETGKTFDFCFQLLRQSTPNGSGVVPPQSPEEAPKE